MDIPYYREYELAWAPTEQERKFRRLLTVVVAVALALGAVCPWIPTREPLPNQVVEIPPRIAKLLLEQRTPPPRPVPRVEKAEPLPEPPSDAIPERVVETPPDIEPVRPAASEPAPVAAAPADTRREARTRAAAAFLPFTESLADLRDSEVVEKVSRAAGSGSLTASVSASVGEGARNERSMITSKAGRSSGGINTASMSRNIGPVALGGRETTRVASTVAAIGRAGGGPERSGVSARPSRSREEIELVFDRNKGAIFALYNRALRQDPTLQGKLVLRLTIAPSGEVTSCEVISSELDNPEMERKLVQRVKLFRFAAKDVAPVTTTKPIDFFPA